MNLPNSRIVAATTRGIARNLWLDLRPDLGPEELGAGGGDLNGTAAPILFGHSGTTADRRGNPRAGGFSGNYCGVV